MFGWVSLVKEHPHECQDPRFSTTILYRSVMINVNYFSCGSNDVADVCLFCVRQTLTSHQSALGKFWKTKGAVSICITTELINDVQNKVQHRSVQRKTCFLRLTKKTESGSDIKSLKFECKAAEDTGVCPLYGGHTIINSYQFQMRPGC